ncbi:MAG: 16S rRNA (cytidine(1402)-2'-O)-methyltransferase [Bacteroidales bacterium]
MAKLYLVPTPIGNLEDITLRSLRILKEEVSLILAEDTRKTAILLRHFSINKPMTAFHQHNEHRVTERFVQQLQQGENMALVTDAGTPGISDPGFLLVRACLAAGVEVECLPGATAFVPALVNSGLPSDRFLFEGFLPHKKGRQTKIRLLATESRTIILYESPHRLVKTLQQLAEVMGADRRASVSRELTKMFEETQRGTLTELITYFSKGEVKGEIVMVIEGNNGGEKEEEE